MRNNFIHLIIAYCGNFIISIVDKWVRCRFLHFVLRLIDFTYALKGLKGSRQRNDKEMGKKETWFSSVKKALSPDPKEKKDQVWEFSLSWGYFILIEIFFQLFWGFLVYLWVNYKKQSFFLSFWYYSNRLCRTLRSRRRNGLESKSIPIQIPQRLWQCHQHLSQKRRI